MDMVTWTCPPPSPLRTQSEYARQGLVRSTLTEAGIPTAGVAAHSMRVGAATAPVHGGLPMPMPSPGCCATATTAPPYVPSFPSPFM